MTTIAIDMATSRMEERAEGQHGRIWAALDRGWLPAAVLAHLARVYWRSPLLLTELFGTSLHERFKPRGQLRGRLGQSSF